MQHWDGEKGVWTKADWLSHSILLLPRLGFGYRLDIITKLKVLLALLLKKSLER